MWKKFFVFEILPPEIVPIKKRILVNGCQCVNQQLKGFGYH